jgi:uncharacterized protein
MSTATLTDNAALVTKMYEAFNRGDIPFIVDQLDDNCKWVSPAEGILPQGGTYIGKEAGAFFQKLSQHSTFNSFHVYSVSNINTNEVVAFGHMSATSKSTGKTADTDWAMHWKFNNVGKVVYYHDYLDTATAYLANQ